MTDSSLIIPNWPAPDNIKAVSTTRRNGFSQAPYHQLNLGTHVGDSKQHVFQNRQQLIKLAKLPESPRWLNQIHSTTLINSSEWQENIDADAIFSRQQNHVCTVMTADCLPILLCNQQGDMVAAIHAGWRGLVSGIIEKTIQQFCCDNSEIIVWLGPAIGPTQFEVGQEVYNKFVTFDQNASHAFTTVDEQHFLADIYQLARQRLQQNGVHAIFGGDFCTVSDKDQFFSYRRDGITGRMASMIWIANK